MSPQPVANSQYAALFYPGTTDPSAAETVTIANSEERTGIDFPVRLIRATEVLGRVVMTNGQPARNVQVTVIANRDNLSVALGDPRTRSVPTSDGRFGLMLQPGMYSIIARSANRPGTGSGRGGLVGNVGEELWALADMVIRGEGFLGVSTLELRPGISVSGRAVFETSTPSQFAGPPPVTIRLSQGPRSEPRFNIGPLPVSGDGTFRFGSVPPGQYMVDAIVAPGSGWRLGSVLAGNHDLLDNAIDVVANGRIDNIVVTVTDKITEVAGQVLDSSGKPTSSYFVGIFPVDSQYWKRDSRRLRLPTRLASDGSFRFTGLPPGDYYLAALSEFNQESWSAPALLERLVPLAVKITLTDGEKKVQNVKIGTGRQDRIQ